MDDPEPAEVFEDNVRALRSALRACIKQLEDLPEEDAAAAAGVLSTARLFERLQDDARAALASAGLSEAASGVQSARTSREIDRPPDEERAKTPDGLPGQARPRHESFRNKPVPAAARGLRISPPRDESPDGSAEWVAATPPAAGPGSRPRTGSRGRGRFETAPQVQKRRATLVATKNTSLGAKPSSALPAARGSLVVKLDDAPEDKTRFSTPHPGIARLNTPLGRGALNDAPASTLEITYEKTAAPRSKRPSAAEERRASLTENARLALLSYNEEMRRASGRIVYTGDRRSSGRELVDRAKQDEPKLKKHAMQIRKTLRLARKVAKEKAAAAASSSSTPPPASPLKIRPETPDMPGAETKSDKSDDQRGATVAGDPFAEASGPHEDGGVRSSGNFLGLLKNAASGAVSRNSTKRDKRSSRGSRDFELKQARRDLRGSGERDRRSKSKTVINASGRNGRGSATMLFRTSVTPSDKAGIWTSTSNVLSGSRMTANDFSNMMKDETLAFTDTLASLAPAFFDASRDLANFYLIVAVPVVLCFRTPLIEPWALGVFHASSRAVFSGGRARSAGDRGSRGGAPSISPRNPPTQALVELACVSDWRRSASRKPGDDEVEGALDDDEDAVLTRKRQRRVATFVDAVAVAPVWTLRFALGRGGGASGAALRALRAAQAAKLLRVARLARGVAASGKESEPRVLGGAKMDPIALRIAKLVAFFALVLHYLACGYHAVGRSRRGGAGSADDEADGRSGEDAIDWSWYARARSDVGAQWLRAYYWATMAAVGNYMKPQNDAQTSFSTAGCLLGIFMTATITGSVASLLANADVVGAQQRERRSRMRAYLKKNKVPESLSDSIHAYYDYRWNSSTASDDKLFSDLTDTLKLKLALAVKRRFILACPLFKALSPYAVISLVQRLEHRIAVPDQVIMAEREHGDSMYFCVRGRLAVTIREKTTRQLITVAEIKTGAYFGEAALVTGEPRSATVTAIAFCELFMLNKASFAAARRENAEFCEAVESQVKRRDLRNALALKLRRVKNAIIAVAAFSHPPSKKRLALSNRRGFHRMTSIKGRNSGFFSQSKKRMTGFARGLSSRSMSSKMMGGGRFSLNSRTNSRTSLNSRKTSRTRMSSSDELEDFAEDSSDAGEGSFSDGSPTGRSSLLSENGRSSMLDDLSPGGRRHVSIVAECDDDGDGDGDAAPALAAPAIPASAPADAPA